MKKHGLIWTNVVLLTCTSVLTVACGKKSGEIQDEAMQAGRSAASLPAADEDYFHDMDSRVQLTSDEVKGRNNWIVWTGGNDRLWDILSVRSFGSLDFVKTISSYPGLKYSRDTRWNYLGLVNEPCYEKATGPDANRYGLWLDHRKSDCPPDPFENEQKYPGVKIGARGKNIPAGSFYGYGTGIVGLRLFPNPAFDEAAQKKWDPKRYYEDPTYYNSKDLIKPYRVGMSCGFCHVGPNPVKPPQDPENPKWENLSSNVGAQYFWVDRIFAWDADASSFVFQVFHTARPGTIDTSLISTDNINNPRTMNAVYQLLPRMQEAKRWGKETLGGGELGNKQFNDYVQSGLLTEFFQKPNISWSPRVLKDGSDSVGALGALNRVFINIGLFSEEWLTHMNPLVGGKRITPMPIAAAHKNSSYWQATEAQTPDLALFFLKTTGPHHLQDAPGGTKYITKDPALLKRGKVVFAETCARCHSSKQPDSVPGLDPDGCSGPHYLDCWNKYWAYTKTDEYKAKMRDIVLADNFLDGNFLSTDQRVPVTLLQTQACSPMASNAIRGNIWDNFSSDTYKELPAVGNVTVYHPYTGAPKQFAMPGGGRGYTRPPSLVSAWSTAPFLLNNSLGQFNPSPSVDARMQSFQNSIEQLLWPEKRDKDSLLGDKIPGRIDRTTQTSYLRVATGYLPDFLQKLVEPGDKFLPFLFDKSGVQIGPIPAGTPVDLIANLEVTPRGDIGQDAEHDAKLFGLLIKLKHDLKQLPANATDEDAKRVFSNAVDQMWDLSTCPDYIVNRGHYFGTSLATTIGEQPLSDADKRALIEFVKTF